MSRENRRKSVAKTAAAPALEGLERRLKSLLREAVEPAYPVPPYLTPAELYDDWPGTRRAYPQGYPQDRKHGQNWPVIRNEDDLRQARAFSRFLADTNPLVIGFLDHITNFVVGPGFKWSVGLKGVEGETGAEKKDPAVRACQSVLDEFRSLNGWGDETEATYRGGDGSDDSAQTDLEAECWRSAMRDGEAFLRLFAGGARTKGVPLVRRVNPECVYCPPGETQEGPWSFGIETDPEDRQTRLSYHVADPDKYPQDGEMVSASKVLHLKLNVDSDVKRGVPDFWPLEKEAQHLRKLWQNMAEVTAILSAIAYIRQHAPGVSGTQIANMNDRLRSGTDFSSAKWGDSNASDIYRTFTRHESGTIIDVTNGMQFQPPPAVTGLPGFIQGMQATLRIFGLRWGCPEYFSGDACLSEDSQILTRRGWVGVHDFRPDDEVGTVNPDTHSLEYQRPSKVWQSHRTGDMIHLETSRFDLLVTPNHDLYTSRLAPSKPNWHKVRADELADAPPVTFGCLSSVAWNGGDTPRKIVIPGLDSHNAADVLRFLGVFVGDGSAAANGSRVTVGGISKPRKVRAYAEVLEPMGFNRCVDKHGRSHWYKDDRDLNAWLREHVGTECKDKRLPSLVWDLSAESLSHLWGGLLESDGYRPKGKKSTCYVTVSEGLADDVQLVCLRLGLCAAVKRNKPGALGNLDVFKVNVKPAGVQTLRANNVTTVKGYDGLVWCVTVPNGLIVSRRNGKVSVSGNSNANFASTLVAGGPFERAAQRRQRIYKQWQQNLAVRVLGMAAEAGRLSLDQLARVSVKATPPAVAIANKAEDTSRRVQLMQAAGLSKRTVLEEEGYDPDREAANTAKEAAEQQPPQMPGEPGTVAPVPQDGPPPDQGGDPLAGLFSEGVGPAPWPGAVFDQASRRWKNPDGGGSPKVGGGTDQTPAPHWSRGNELEATGDEEAKDAFKDMMWDRTDLDSVSMPDADTAHRLFGFDNATAVDVSAWPDGDVDVEIQGDGFKAQRRLKPVGEGRLACENVNFVVDEGRQNEGIGVRAFAAQAKRMSEAGILYIECAAGKGGQPPMNGYYTWPRFGYDQALDDEDGFLDADLPTVEECRRLFPDARTVLDVMATTEGREWWKANGVQLQNARFDLTPGSRSMAILAAYLDERAARKKESRSRTYRPTTRPPLTPCGTDSTQRLPSGKTVRESTEPVPPELLAAILQAYSRGDEGAVAELVELAGDPDLLAAVLDGPPDDAALTEAKRDRSHLVFDKIKKRWVNPDKKAPVRKTPAGQLTPKEQLVARKQAAEPVRQAAREAWAGAVADPTKITPDQLAGLAGHLGALTRDELRTVARGLQKKVGGLKRELVDRLLTHVGQPPTGGGKKAEPGADQKPAASRNVLDYKNWDVTDEEFRDNLTAHVAGLSGRALLDFAEEAGLRATVGALKGDDARRAGIVNQVTNMRGMIFRTNDGYTPGVTAPLIRTYLRAGDESRVRRMVDDALKVEFGWGESPQRGEQLAAELGLDNPAQYGRRPSSPEAARRRSKALADAIVAKFTGVAANGVRYVDGVAQKGEEEPKKMTKVKRTSTSGQGDISGDLLHTDTLKMPNKGQAVDAKIEIVKLDSPVNGFGYAMVADAAGQTRWRLFKSEDDARAELARSKEQSAKQFGVSPQK